MKSIVYLIIVSVLGFGSGCLEPKTTNNKPFLGNPSTLDPPIQNVVQENGLVLPDELGDTEIAQLIVAYGGHEHDPQLENGHGISDEELASLSTEEIQYIISVGEELALNESSPGYLFALGRMAWFIHDPRGITFLRQAAERGSTPAFAYLGYDAAEKGEIGEALQLMETAKKRGFTDPMLLEQMNILREHIFDPQKFNRSDFITALYKGNFKFLEQNEPLSSLYTGMIQNTLNESSILFLVEDPTLLLHLDAEVSAVEGKMAEMWSSTGIDDFLKLKHKMEKWLLGSSSSSKQKLLEDGYVIKEMAIQDARRLALFFESNRKEFNQVYDGIKEYSKSKR